MNHVEVRTTDDAKKYLLERGTVTRGALHMLGLQLRARDELLVFVRDHNIKLTGTPGR